MTKNCPGCGENYERQCSECDQADREQNEERKELRIEILKSRIFKRSMELQKKFNVLIEYDGERNKLCVRINPKEVRLTDPYMVSLYALCSNFDAERDLQVMLEEIKLCLML
jgi:DnaJ-class molecular chaperone